MPVRSIPINSRVITGYFYSKKNSRPVAYESLIERDYFLFLEFEDAVEKYEEQPIAITKLIEGIERTYFPDCMVTYKPEFDLSPMLGEVKSSEDLQDEEKAEKLKLKFAALEEYAAGNGLQFKLVLDTDIRGTSLENLKFLYRYIDPPNNFESYKERILETLLTNGTIAVSTLLDLLTKDKLKQAAILPSLWHLLSIRTIKTDLNKPLTNNSVIEGKQ